MTDGPSRPTDLAAPFDVSLPAISKHLRVLEKAGLVRRRREGRTSHVELVTRGFDDAATWLSTMERYWQRTLDGVARRLQR